MSEERKLPESSELPKRVRTYGRKLSRFRDDMAADAQDKLHTARRNARRFRQRADDAVDNVALEIRQRPIEAFSVALLAGAVLGVALGIALGRQRSRREFDE